ncbi:unnamed protein product [Rotaria sp. Silwood1]|nr:unnamed protein product [Rotaria sp. Silwood1]
MKITALNPFQYNYNGIKAALAGAYLQVKGPKGQTIVYVTDLYPEGPSGALDLSPNAFSEIGNMVDGKIDIQWKIVQAPITGNLSYRIKEGSSQWWAGIQVRNHKFPVVKLEYSKDEQWINLEKMDYNHFVGTDLGSKPLRLRMTDIRGMTVIDSIPPLSDNGSDGAYIVPGNVQFPDRSNSDPPIIKSKVVALQSNANGKFVCAENAGNSALVANRDSPSSWEKFDLIILNENNVALKSHANGQYVCAENGGNSPLIANRASISSWETFKMIHRSNGKVAFIAVNGNYVCADDFGNKELIANRNSIDSWETFDLISQ